MLALLKVFRVPAFYASLGALLAVLGIEIHAEAFDRIAEALAALSAIIGIITSALSD